jgi:hypothetical protein
MTLAELLADEFGKAWDNLTPNQQQVLLTDVEGIRDEEGMRDTDAVKTLARRIKPASLDDYVTTLMIAANRKRVFSVRCKGCKKVYPLTVSEEGYQRWRSGTCSSKRLCPN